MACIQNLWSSSDRACTVSTVPGLGESHTISSSLGKGLEPQYSKGWEESHQMLKWRKTSKSFNQTTNVSPIRYPSWLIHSQNIKLFLGLGFHTIGYCSAINTREKGQGRAKLWGELRWITGGRSRAQVYEQPNVKPLWPWTKHFTLCSSRSKTSMSTSVCTSSSKRITLQCVWETALGDDVPICYVEV